jgi:iron complex transport system ATP-binding protein
VSDIIPEIDRVIMLREGSIFADGRCVGMLTSEQLSSLFEMELRVERRGEYYSIEE